MPAEKMVAITEEVLSPRVKTHNCEVAGREVTHLGRTTSALQIVGRRLEDALVLRAAAAFEIPRPWAAQRPSESSLGDKR